VPSSSASGAIGDPGDVPVGEPADSLAAAADRAEFNVLVPNNADANAQNVTAIYADPSAVEMHFPPPGEQSKQLDPPYIDVIEENGDGNDPPMTTQQDLALLRQASKQAGDAVGPKLVSECNVGSLSAVCIAAAGVEQEPPEQQPECRGTSPIVCAGPYPNTAFVRFVDGNVAVEIRGGTSLDRLIAIGKSMSPQGSASSGAG
jgi:hypothetical protein